MRVTIRPAGKRDVPAAVADEPAEDGVRGVRGQWK